MMPQFKILFMGTSRFAVPALQALVAGGQQVAAVITRPDKPAGRGLQVRHSPVKEAAESLGLAVWQPRRVSSPESQAEIAQLAPELTVVAAYGQLLSQAVLDIPRLGNINIHGSLLPRYRGAAPIQRAIMAGETETGVTTIWMSAGLDEGDIILQRTTPIGPAETYGALHDRLALLGAELLMETIAAVAAGTAPRLPQDNTQASFAPPIRPAETHLRWESPAAALFDLLRALAPAPGGYSFWRGKRLKIWQAEKINTIAGIPGKIVEFSLRGPVVATGSGGLCLVEVQPEGRKRMSGGEFVRGYRPNVGDILE